MNPSPRSFMPGSRNLYETIFDALNKRRLPALGRQEMIVGAARLGILLTHENLNGLLDYSFNGAKELTKQDFVQLLYIIENTDPKNHPSVLFYTADQM